MDAEDIKYALTFDRVKNKTQPLVGTEPQEDVLTLSSAPRKESVTHTSSFGSDPELRRLQSALEEMTRRMEALESSIRHTATSDKPQAAAEVATRGTSTRTIQRRNSSQERRICFNCCEEGHIRRNCPLNYLRPARMAGGWPGRQY